MLELSVLVRSIQLFVHHAHLLCARAVFMPDHLLLADIYSQAEDWFDGVSERMIGLGAEKELEFDAYMAAVAKKLKGLPSTGAKENKEFFAATMGLLNEMTDMIEKLAKEKGMSQGTINMLAGIADQAEVFKYKVGRRIM